MSVHENFRPCDPAADLCGESAQLLARLGSADFRADHRVRHAYVAGAMFKGIASRELVVRMGRSQLLGYLGTGGLSLERVAADIAWIQAELGRDGVYGMNLLCQPQQPELEEALVDLFLKTGVRRVEAAAYTQATPALVRWRAHGIAAGADGALRCTHKVLAKVSRPEVAAAFLAPPPARMVERMLERGSLTAQQAQWVVQLPLCDDLCVEADSGGHTDQGVAYALLPAILLQRDQAQAQFGYGQPVRVGAAGGLGTPAALAASFLMGADFVLTGSVNQCSVEAGTSVLAKDLLQQAGVQDTAIAPAGDMFESGARVQVLRKGLFFAARAQKLYELWQRHDGWHEIDAKTRAQIEKNYFAMSYEAVWRETRNFYSARAPQLMERADHDLRQQMALVFRWYFVQANRFAMQGVAERKVDFQIQCGPALGAFNQWVKGTLYEDWRARHVDEIAELLMRGCARLLTARFGQWLGTSAQALATDLV